VTSGDYYVGLMSGTSADGTDAVVIEFTGGKPTLVATHFAPYSDSTRAAIQALTIAGGEELTRMGILDQALASCFAEAALRVIEEAGIDRQSVRAIGSHGQTLRHHPEGSHPFTLQIGDPNRIAELTGITTVADFRRRDMAAGGQGAPLAPGFHRAVFGRPGSALAVLNVGGIANVSLLTDAEPVLGFDTGPGNTLMDLWTQRHQHTPFDRDGVWAMSGNVDPPLLSRFLADPFFALTPPKSTGPDYFSATWLEQHLSALATVPAPQDVQRTLLELTAHTVVEELRAHRPEQLAVCGGGAHNGALLARLSSLMPQTSVTTTEPLGIHPDWVEAVCFAWLAARRLEGKSGNEPAVTGASGTRVLGAVYHA
jgi:anhydro-N-acetylmuramic acid kinase